MVDQAVIQTQASFLQRALDRLKERQPASFEAFQGDMDLQDIVLHNLQVAIQGCIDMASHVVTDERWEVPQSSSELFRVLKQHRVIGPELSEQMASLVKLRNELVHEYAHVHLDWVYRALQEGLQQIEEFRRQICQFAKL